jgi:anti-sigma factor RsiW
MKMFDDNMSCEEVRDLLDACLDGELTPPEAALVESHLSWCRNCSEELDFAKDIRNALHALPEKECPEGIVQSALETIDLKEKEKSAPPVKYHVIRDLFKWRWAAGAVAALIALVIGLSLLRKPPQPSETLTREQIEQARAEVELTFACIGSIGYQSAAAVYNDVVASTVVPSVKKAVEETIETKALPFKKEKS